MPIPIDRREFLQGAAAGALGVAATTTRSAGGPVDAGEFVAPWKGEPDRAWLGPEFWAGPLQDWRINGGRAECHKAAPDREVQLLTRQVREGAGRFESSVRVRRVGGGPIGGGPGSFGFRVGVKGPLREYRNSLVFGKGIDAGVRADGLCFIGAPGEAEGRVKLDLEEVLIVLVAETNEDFDVITLRVVDPESGRAFTEVKREFVAGSVAGNLALAVNYPSGGASRPAASKAQTGAAKAKAAAKGQGGVPGGMGAFAFEDWRVSGTNVEANDDRAFGPILFSQYTLSRGVLKMTAQMPPVGADDEQFVRLEIDKGKGWESIAKATIHPQARTATFRIDAWDDAKEVPYRLAYALRHGDDRYWTGTVRRDPVDRPVLTVADVSCNAHYAFPNADYVARMAEIDPDLIAFTGDQFYEPSGGYGVLRSPTEPAILDMLRKWYLHGWTWRDLTRDRPSVSIPDDHDVYQGNVWGEAGAGRRGTQEMGGYEMPVEWVNAVHLTQTSHHPDPFDPEPTSRGISVYFGALTYGRVSFAVIADRQFKSGPQGKVPPTGSRGDHVIDENFDPKTADLPGLELLGDRQIAFLRDWAADWRGADMKAVISQTIFTAMATTHGGNRERLRADYDTNGWPQSARNVALREARKAFAFHIAGDQHLPAVVQYGVDEPGDAAVAFAGPAVNNLYPRWWKPTAANAPPAPGASLGEFVDSFGSPLTVLAVANPKESFRPGVLESEVDKSAGVGVVRFDRRERTITVDCWPFLADVSRPGTQFPGWPVAVKQLQCYGRKASAYLPELRVQGAESPVVKVVDESNGEIVYTIRSDGPTFRPFVYAEGRYALTVGDPDAGKSKEIKGIEARAENAEILEVTI